MQLKILHYFGHSFSNLLTFCVETYIIKALKALELILSRYYIGGFKYVRH